MKLSPLLVAASAALVVFALLSAAACASFVDGDAIYVEQVSYRLTPEGNDYVVEGIYTLRSRPVATLGLFVTTNYPSDAPSPGHRTVKVSAGTGRFVLDAIVLEPGLLHVSYYPVNGGASFFTTEIGHVPL